MSFNPHSATGSKRRGRRRFFEAAEPLAEINVTPMVDVMLVLLVIFMVAAPLLTVGIQVDLPKTQARALTDQKEPLTISIKKDGAVFVQETKTTKDRLIANLQAVTKHNPDVKIYVRADEGIAYGEVMQIMGDLSANGFSKFAFITEQQKSAPSVQQKKRK